MKDTRAYAFIGNRDAAQYCDECQEALVGFERFVCCRCDPDAHEWEWEDHDGEVWEDPERGVLLVIGTYEPEARCLECLVLDGFKAPIYASWPSWEAGERVTYPRSMFVQGRVDGTMMRKIT